MREESYRNTYGLIDLDRGRKVGLEKEGREGGRLIKGYI